MNARIQDVVAGVAIDSIALIAVTVLGVQHVIPSEAVVGIIGTIVGARAMLRGRNGGVDSGTSAGSLPPATGIDAPGERGAGVSQFSALAGLLLALNLLPGPRGGV